MAKRLSRGNGHIALGRLLQQPAPLRLFGYVPPAEAEERYYAMLDDTLIAA